MGFGHHKEIRSIPDTRCPGAFDEHRFSFLPQGQPGLGQCRQCRDESTHRAGTGITGKRVSGLSGARTPQTGLRVEAQVPLPVVFEGEKLEAGYRIDLLVEGLVVVEIKCVEAIHPVHQAQLLSYLRLSGRNVGLLINFYVAHLKDGITRMVDGYNWEKP